MELWLILSLGIILGVIANRTGFCVTGAFTDYFVLGRTDRLKGLLAAMMVFGLVWTIGADHPNEYAGVRHLLGGLIQGIGFVLAAGCPLGLLLRVGEGSKSHFLVVVAFLLGAGIFSLVGKPLVELLNHIQYTGSIALIG